MTRFACIAGGLIVVCALTTPACGDEDGSAAFSSGLRPDELIANLDTAETRQLCVAVTDYYASHWIPPECKIAGFDAAHIGASTEGMEPPVPGDADVRKTCSEAEAACKKAAPKTVEPSPACSGGAGWKSSCRATVDEFEACISDAIAWANAMQSARARSVPSCSTLTVEDLSTAGHVEPMPPPRSCTLLDETCPHALQSGSSAQAPATPADAGSVVDAGPVP